MSETWFEDIELAESPFAAEAEAPMGPWPSESAGLPPSWPEDGADGVRGEQPFASEAQIPPLPLIRSGPVRKLTVDRVPPLDGHRGPGPDLILGWNVLSVPKEIDVVVHLHGNRRPKTTLHDVRRISGLDLEPVGWCSVTAQGRLRPTLTVLPKGNDTGERQRGSEQNKYNFPKLTAKNNGVPDLVRFSLKRFADELKGNPPRLGRLILTAHSSGGGSLLKILQHRGTDDPYDPHQVHVFDALYGDLARDPKLLAPLVAWAERRIDVDRNKLAGKGATAAREYMTTHGGALRVFYVRVTNPKLRDSTRINSRALYSMIAPKLDPLLKPWYRVELSCRGHFEIPTEYGWRLLADASADVPATIIEPVTQPGINPEFFDEAEEPEWAATELEEEELEEEDFEEELEAEEELDDEAEPPGSGEEPSQGETFESVAGEVLEGVLGQVSELGRLSEDMERIGRQFEHAPATEAAIADVVDLGKGIGRLGQGIGAALSAGPASPAADVSVAVPEFNFLTRLSTPAPLLDAAASAKAVQWNRRHHPATSGVDPKNIRTDVARYVNLTVIEKMIQNFNAANPTKAIQLGTPPIDAVLVEGIHQFQAKCFFETKTTKIDGMAGESTLDSLGLVKRSGMHSVDKRNTKAHGRLGKVKPSVAKLTSDDFTADTWFNHMVNPSFLGWRFLTGGNPRGVHLSFMRKLRIAERALLAQPRFSGMTPVKLGETLGFNASTEEHKGARPTEPGPSMHTYGLAVDITYTGNPWVRGADFLAALKNAALLMSGVQINQKTSQRFLHDLGSDPTLTTAAIYDILAQRNRDFRSYLALSAKPDGLTAVLQARRADHTAGVFTTATEPITDAAKRWRTAVQNDLSKMRDKDSPFRKTDGTLRDPLLGFLNLDRDLVIALRDTACLAWGAVDFGSRASGDVMHFDDRVCGIGLAVAKVGGNTPPKSGHPCVACGTPAASHEGPEVLEGGDFETEWQEEI